VTVIGDALLKHGFTLTHLDQLTRRAVRQSRVHTNDYAGTYDTAWSGIVEALYSADEPDETTLVYAGIAALKDDREQDWHSKGLLDGDKTYRPQPGPNFSKFWSQSTVSHFPEDRIIDHLAAVQVLPQLSKEECDALLAVAVHQHMDDAAKSLGIGRSTLIRRLHTGRELFRRWWHEGETPPDYSNRTLRPRAA
jgi:hypothetical protein